MDTIGIKPSYETIFLNKDQRFWLHSLVLQYGLAVKEHDTDWMVDTLIKIDDILYPCSLNKEYDNE